MENRGSMQVQQFFLHHPQGLRPYLCVANQDRWPFDFSDNQFKPASELRSPRDASFHANGRQEARAAYGYAYSVDFDLQRLLLGGNRDRIPLDGALISIHWLVQQDSEPDLFVDKQVGSCCLRLVGDRFEPADSSSAKQLDESIAFADREEFRKEYRDFEVREFDELEVRHQSLEEAFQVGSIADALRVLAEDVSCWAMNLKSHLYHHTLYSATDPMFVRMRDVPEDAPFEVIEPWIVRDWIGSHETYDLLEFHKTPEYAKVFAARLESLNQSRRDFAKALNKCTVDGTCNDLECLLELDETRKDLKHHALWLADHLRRIAVQFDGAANSFAGSATGALAASTVQGDTLDDRGPTRFSGGTMAFHADQVEFCGVDICSGPRSRTRRKLLDLLRRKRSDGTFVSYSGDKLAAEAGLTGGAPGAVRDLREAIRAALRDGANIICGKDDVVLSGGPGYRLSESVAIELSPDIVDMTTDIMDTGDVRDDYDQSDSDVLDVPDAPALARQAWIIEQLEKGVQLKGPDIAQNFACSAKTAHRDLTALKQAGTIEFVGTARSGYYRICPTGNED